MSETLSSPFAERIPYFLRLLGEWGTGVPLQSQWVLEFESFPSALINQVSRYENYLKASNTWNIGPLLAPLVSSELQETKGCIFAQGIRMPPEGIGFDRVGEYNGAYMRGPITTQRIDHGTFDVAFLETNASFADLVLRPWAIRAAHQSLIARGEQTANGQSSTSPKVRISVHHLAKAGANKAPLVRKTFNFYGCVPTVVDSEDYSNEGEKIIQRQCSFLFSYYTVSLPDNQF